MCLHGKRSKRRETRAREARLRMLENSVKLPLLFPDKIIRSRLNCTNACVTDHGSSFGKCGRKAKYYESYLKMFFQTTTINEQRELTSVRVNNEF